MPPKFGTLAADDAIQSALDKMIDTDIDFDRECRVEAQNLQIPAQQEMDFEND